MPCERSTSKGLRCVRIDEDKTKLRKCSECVKARSHCEGMGKALSSRWCPILLVLASLPEPLTAERIAYEFRRLEREEEQAQEELVAYQAGMGERVACLVRLQRQKKLVREKGVKMVERGLKDLDELEALEVAEASAAAPSAAAMDLNWSATKLPCQASNYSVLVVSTVVGAPSLVAAGCPSYIPSSKAVWVAQGP